MIRITTKVQLRALRKSFKQSLLNNGISLPCRSLDESFSRLLGYRDFNHLVRLAKRFPDYQRADYGYLPTFALNPQGNTEEAVKAELVNLNLDDSLFMSFIGDLDSTADNSPESLVNYLYALKNAFIANDKPQRLDLRHYRYISQSAALAISHTQFTTHKAESSHHEAICDVFSGSYGYHQSRLVAIKNKNADQVRQEIYGWLYDTGFGIRVNDDHRVYVTPMAVYHHKAVMGNQWSVTVEMTDGTDLTSNDILAAIAQINMLWVDTGGRGLYTSNEVPNIDLKGKTSIKLTYSSTFRGKLMLVA